MVGTSQGSVNRQRQGVGLATVLQGDRALDTAERLYTEDRAVARQQQAQKKAALDAGYDRMQKFTPDHWYKHDNQIQDETDAWFNAGVQLMNRGVDPWKSTDAESTAFRTKYLDIAGKAAASKQLQERFNSVRNKIDGADPGKYTNRSLSDIADFFEKPLDEIVGAGMVPPELEQRTPFIQLNDFYSKTMQPLNQTRNGNPYTDAEIWDIAKKSLQDPEKGDDLADSFRSAYRQMDADERVAIEKKAKAAGVSVPQQMAYDYASLYATQQKPFEYAGWKKAAVDRVKVPYRAWKGSESFSKKVDKAELAKITETVAKDMFVADPRALQEYEQVLPRNDREDDGKYRQRAIKHLAESLRSEVATQEEAGQTATGEAKQDQLYSQRNWLNDMLSMDTDRNKEAIGFLMSAPGIFPGLTVQNGAVYEDEPGKRELKLYLAGNLEYAKVKKAMNEGGIVVEQEQVEPRSTNTIVTVPITTQTENALMRLHDHAFEDTKIPYGGAYNTTKPDLRALVNPATATETTPTTPTKRRF